MKFITVDQFIEIFATSNKLGFQDFFKKAQVKTPGQLIPLKQYMRDHEIPASSIKLLFENIVNRNEYLQRFYEKSLRVLEPISIVDKAMPVSAMNNDAHVNYKNIIRNMFYKEILRFWKVGFQTVAAPVMTAMLYLLIFGHVLEDRVKVYDQITYTAFLLPGLVMMSVLQNAFANSSSSLIQSKMMGNLVFLLLTPLNHWSWFFAYVGSSVVRGLAVGLGVFVVTGWFTPLSFVSPQWIVLFAIMGATMLGSMGVIAGLWAEKFDQMAAFQNFIIMPMTFLSGVFYSIHSLPPFWQTLSHFNPFFYMIDGFRYGFFGVSDVSPWLSLAVVGSCTVLISATALHLLRIGFKIRG